MSSDKTSSSDLQYGEAYRTTKAHKWSKHDRDYTKIEIPEDELLIFRSFIPIKGKPDMSLALFVWIKKQETVCLSVSGLDCWFHAKHVDWEKRHFSLKTKNVVNDEPEEVN